MPTPCRFDFRMAVVSGLQNATEQIQSVTNFLSLGEERAGRARPLQTSGATHSFVRASLKVAATRSKPSEVFGGGEDFLGVGEEGFLERRRVGDGRVERGDAEDGAVEVVEGFLEEDGGDFA